MQIAGYEVTQELGRGGMAVVYKARQSSLGRDVAIKVISAELSQNEDFKRRFLREAKTIANLHHPNIIKVFDIGEADGRLFYVMEYHGGRTLESKATAGLKLDEILQIFAKLAEALAEAHARDTIHRDVKPANILFSAQNEPVLSDFGIARRTDMDTVATMHSVTMGTPAYMAPELFQKGEASVQSDMYALGIILYELLAGQPPFKAPTYWAYGDLHCRTPVPELGQDRVCFQHLLEKMLAKNPSDRYTSLHAMLAEWRTIDAVAGAGARTSPPTDVPGYTVVSEHAPERDSGVVKESPSEQTAFGSTVKAAAVAVTALFCGAVFLWLTLRQSGDADRAQTREQAAPDRIVVTAEPYGALDSIDPFEALSQAVFMDELIHLEERFASLDPATQALGQCASNVARYRINRSESDLVIAEDYCRRGSSGPPLRVAEINGWLSFYQGDYADSQTWFKKALTIDDTSAEAQWGLAKIQEREGKFDAAASLYAEAAVNSPGNWRIQNAVGMFLYRRGRLSEARQRLELSLDLSPGNVAVLNNLGLVHLFQQDYAGAIASWDRVLAETPRSKQGLTLLNLGGAYYLMGDFTGARIAYERAAELVTNDYRMWANVGDAYANEGNEASAERAYRRALDRAQLILDSGSQDPNLLAGIASLQAALQIAGATELLRKALAASPADPEINRLAAQTYLRLGQPEPAYERLQMAISAGYPSFILYDDPQFKVVLNRNSPIQ